MKSTYLPTRVRPPMAPLAHSLIARALIAVSLLLPACSSDNQEAPLAPIATDAGEASVAADGGADAAADAGPALPGNPDPQDLDPTNGDRALDIASSEIFFDNGAPWVRVMFYGDWPPSAQLYSWSCTVLLGTVNAPVASYTTQAFSGAPVTLADGIDEAKITYAVEPRGFRVLFGDPALAFDRYGIECTVQKTTDATSAQDTSGTFVVTGKIQRTFGN